MTLDNRGGSGAPPATTDPHTSTDDPHHPAEPQLSAQSSSHIHDRTPRPTTRRNLRKSLSLSSDSHGNALSSDALSLNFPYAHTLTSDSHDNALSSLSLFSDSHDNTHTSHDAITPKSDGRRTPSRVRFNAEVDVLMFADVAAAAAAADLATALQDVAAEGANRYKNKHGHAAVGEYHEIAHALGSDSEGEEGEEGEMGEQERELVSSVSLPPLSFSLLLAQEGTSTAVSSPTRFPRRN
ncbi:unnamed protein product [Closterium sp. Yama58-4]|nr:unnamed protein product [Closterium sp. Yama58-4]